MKIPYLSAHYFDEIVYRIENSNGHVIVNVDDKDKWLEEFKKARPAIKSIALEQVPGRKNQYYVSANI